MKSNIVFVSLLFALSLCFAADFSIAPYLYSSEQNATVTYTTFLTANNSTAKLASVGGSAALLTINGSLVADKGTISNALTYYYDTNFYPSASDFALLKGYADAFNNSRNAVTKFGQAEKVCYTQGTFLSTAPCSDLISCEATASLVCTISGSDGCETDVLGTAILGYSKDISALNSAYSKFITAYNTLSPSTLSSSFDTMNSAFDDMKTAADTTMKSKLIYPEDFTCMDCMGVCPEPKFNYAAITSGKALISTLRSKSGAFSNLNQLIESVFASTSDRVSYKQGEEQAAVYVPLYDAAYAKFGGLKAQAVMAKALASDSDFVSAADSFISKADGLQQAIDKRNFTGFDAMLLSYQNSGSALAAMVNNSTDAYYAAVGQQDSAGDLLLQAMWKVEGGTSAAQASYNALAARKLALDKKFSPPMTKSQYASLSQEYAALSSDTRQFLSSSGSPTDSIFAAGNSLERTSVDGAMTLASSFVPISFNTRQSIARYIPPIVLGTIDLSLLAVVLVVFAGVFYKFHGFFRNKLAISGWALTAAAFVFVLLIGSVGFYSIVLSAEKYATFSDFFNTVKASGTIAVVVRETGTDSQTSAAMEACADQIRSQAALLGKKTIKYYISGSSCHQFIPSGNNSSSYKETNGLLADACLNSMPDVPVFDLQYSASNQPPAFTTVVVQQAIFKGNTAYYAKQPMCDVANVLG